MFSQDIDIRDQSASAAFFELFTASTGTGIVSTDFGLISDDRSDSMMMVIAVGAVHMMIMNRLIEFIQFKFRFEIRKRFFFLLSIHGRIPNRKLTRFQLLGKRIGGRN